MSFHPATEIVLDELKALLDKVQDPLLDDWDPVRMGLLISKLEYPELDVEEKLVEFDKLVQQLKAELKPHSTIRDQSVAISKFFSDTLNFQGDQTNYYNYKNSLLSDVLLRRKGIPVSLSLIYMGLCRGVGLKALGINFPGHFLVKLTASEEHIGTSPQENVSDWMKTWFVDCFDGGKLLTVEDCESRLKEWTRGVIPFTPDVLKISHPVEILSRMLRNLKAIFHEKEDYARLYWVLSALIHLCPQDRTDAYRERGLLLGRMGRFQLALQDLRYFLEHAADNPRREYVQRLVRQFESQSDMMN